MIDTSDPLSTVVSKGMEVTSEPAPGLLTKNTPVVFYFRFREGEGVRSHGGAAAVYLPDTKTLGISLCSPSDNFCKQTGRTKAMHRAKNAAKVFDDRQNDRKLIAHMAIVCDAQRIQTMSDVKQVVREFVHLAITMQGRQFKKHGSIFAWWSPNNLVKYKKS